MRWGAWVDGGEETSVETWRSDQDLLVHTLSGQSLPVGNLKIRRYCKLSGEFTTLAALRGAAHRCLARVTTEPAASISWRRRRPRPTLRWRPTPSFFTPRVQRAMASGATVLGNTRESDRRPPACRHPAILATSGRRRDALFDRIPVLPWCVPGG